MASSGSKSCSSSSQSSPAMIVQEKGSRNKRKFRAETPLTDPKVIPESQGDGTSYEITAENMDKVQSHGSSIGSEASNVKQDNAEALQLDLGLSCAVGASELGLNQCGAEFEARQTVQNADWNDPNESELEKLVYSNLDSNLKNAIKRIVAYGYNEEVVFTALSKAGQCHGMKDTVANLVDSTLTFLRGSQEIRALRDYNFEDLLELERYMVAESVCVVKQMKPSASTGEAMWFLLVCDMNLSHGCVIETDQMSSMAGEGVSNGTFSALTSALSCSDQKTLEPGLVGPIKTNPSVGCSSSGLPEVTEVVSNPYGHTFQSEAPPQGVSNSNSIASVVTSGVSSEKGSPMSSAGMEKTFSLAGASHIPISEEKFVGCRKVSGMTKREYIFRQKSLPLEKHHRTYGSKGSSRAGKLNHFGGLVLDKKLKHMADSTCLNARNALRIGNTIGVELAQDNVNHHSFSTTIAFPLLPSFSMENDNFISTSSEPNVDSPVPTADTSAADTELSLSLPMESSYAAMPVNHDTEVSNISYNVEPVDRSDPNRALEDKKDEMIQNLVSRVRELQNQLQEWTEWANQKVMQAARRLSKDKAELKALRQEKEEVERLKKEKQTLEENTMKKLSEMENALCKASGQVERANTAVRRLEVENAALRQEMEVAKSRAAESAASLEEVSKREKENMMKFQSQEKLKAMYSEELAAEKRKFINLKQKLEKAEDLRNQLEARWNQEVKAKEELLLQASVLKKEREKIEATVKSKEGTMKSKGENNLNKHKDEIQKLEMEISKLRLKMDSTKIAALRRGIDASYASRLTDSKNIPTPQKSHTQYISKAITDLEDYSGIGCVKRDRECVMCLSEEMSIVFLPCAHQVVCTKCNELHEKQGMEDCPSCRTPIQQRMCVRYAHS